MVVNGSSSDALPVLSGVPQGSVVESISDVYPHLEYASQVWNTHKTGEIKTLN